MVAIWKMAETTRRGPLRPSPTHAGRLAGLEAADSVALSAHQWLFQPKDSALVLFRDFERAHAAIGRTSGYPARPNVCVQGSRGLPPALVAGSADLRGDRARAGRGVVLAGRGAAAALVKAMSLMTWLEGLMRADRDVADRLRVPARPSVVSRKFIE